LQLFGQTHLEDNVYKFNQSFLDFFIKALEDILNAEPQISKGQQINEITGDKIFIIHGHDKELKNEVQLLLYRAGVDDIVLHEQPDKGRTIIDKLIEESKDACYVIALLSPDDELANGTSQARQNVILEIGYFLGKLGKERVRLLKKGQVDIPSDLQGILYEVYDKDGAWRIKLLKEMKAAGISIDVDSVLKKF
jgi:predicted nucleotide-binding protein